MADLVIIGDDNYTDHIEAHSDDQGKRKKGYVPRDYLKYPLGYYPGEVGMHAVDMPQISPSDFPKLIEEMEKDERSLWHFWQKGKNGSPIPCRDQNGKGYCATADTEVLTTKGWMAYPEYDWTTPIATVNRTTHAMEFQRPFERHVYEYDGPMIYSTNRRLDFGVTPDHQMYVRKWDERRRKLSPGYSFVRAADIGWYSGMMPAPRGQIGTEFVELEVPGDRRYDGDDFLALLGLIVSDGYAGGSESTRNWVSFACFRADTLESVRALAARVGFRENPSRPGVFARYNAGALAAWMRENAYAGGQTGAQAKRVPDIVKAASVRQIKHFLHWFDDRDRSGTQFYSSSKRLIDDLQELHLRIGKRGSIFTAPAKESRIGEKTVSGKGGWVLHVGQADRLCIDRKKHIEQERYKGLVYCAAVPNHTLITRRNGSVLISSNCWAHSGVSAHLMLRARDDMPYVDLSAYAIACQIKSFRDEGGWGAQGLDWQMQYGCPTSATWPQQSMSRSNVNDAMKAESAKHKLLEGWIDSGAQYDRNLTFNQVITCLLCCVPVIVDYNWWSHSICAGRAGTGRSLYGKVRTRSGKKMTGKNLDKRLGTDNPVTAGIAVMIANSWGDSWSENGWGWLTGNKAVPDGATAPRVAAWSLN